MTLRILAGSGSNFGSGHIIRMKKLTALLQKEFSSVEILEITSEYQGYNTVYAPSLLNEIRKKRGPIVLDARDMDPRPLLGSGPVIALDNPA